MSADQTDLSSSNAVPWQPSQRYPDPLVRIIDDSFSKYRLSLAKVERIATGRRWSDTPNGGRPINAGSCASRTP